MQQVKELQLKCEFMQRSLSQHVKQKACLENELLRLSTLFEKKRTSGISIFEVCTYNHLYMEFTYRISSIKRPPSFKRPLLISGHLILKCWK